MHKSRYDRALKIFVYVMLVVGFTLLCLVLTLLAYLTFIKHKEPTPEGVLKSYIFFIIFLISIFPLIILIESGQLAKIRNRAIRKTRKAIIAATFPSTVIPDKIVLSAVLPLFFFLWMTLVAACSRLFDPWLPLTLSGASALFMVAFFITMGHIYMSKALRRFSYLIELVSKLKFENGSVLLPAKYFVSEAIAEVTGVYIRRGYSYKRALIPVRDIGLTDRIDLDEIAKAFTLVYGEYAIYVRLPAFILSDSKGSKIALAVLDPSIYQTLEAHSTASLTDEAGTASAFINISGGCLKGHLRFILLRKVRKARLWIRARLPKQARRPAGESEFVVYIPVLEVPPVSTNFAQRLLPERLTLLLFFEDFCPRDLPSIFNWPHRAILGFSHGSYELVLELKKGMFRKVEASASIHISRQPGADGRFSLSPPTLKTDNSY